jgi:hypothetical protein
MDNPEKLASQITQDEKKTKKTYNAISAGHHYTQTKI